MSDAELLEHYVQHRSSEAFAEMVQRHIDLVFSVARRQAGRTLAEDVTQSVFIELARHAHRIQRGTPLVAWLHVVARRATINAVREAVRRQAREKAAAEVAAMKDTSPEWMEIEPLLDEAVESLKPADRHALLLRYFENRPLREVGAALGLTEDAAQKRVARAVDQLREFFVRRGLGVTVSGLAVELSAHAMELAPSGAAAVVSAAALSGLSGFGFAGAVQTSRTFIMTTLHKVTLGTAVAAVLAVGSYEAVTIRRERRTIAALEQRVTADAAEKRRLTEATRATREKLAAVEQRIDSRLAAARDPGRNEDLALRKQIDAWVARVKQIKQLLAERPQDNVPELGLLDEDAWFTVADAAKFDSPEDIRRTLAALRSEAGRRVAGRLGAAVRAYRTLHGYAKPTSIQDIAPLIDPPLDAAIVIRCAVIPWSGGNRLIFPAQPVDLQYDMCYFDGPSGSGSAVAQSFAISEAINAYTQANRGQAPSMADQVTPYLRWPVERERVQRYIAAAAKQKQTSP